MQSNSIVQSVENASIANTVLVVPSDRSFSSTPTVTAPTTTTTTTAADLTALVVDRAVGSAPSPFLVSSDVFPGHLPHPPPLLPLTTVSVHRRRAFSKSGMPAIVKRSASTPNVRGVAADMAALSYAADKRRNKLGYHRTSVACGTFATVSNPLPFLVMCLAGPYSLRPQSAVARDLTRWWPRRTLPEAEDQMFACAGRPSRSMLQLYPVEEGLQLFPR